MRKFIRSIFVFATVLATLTACFEDQVEYTFNEDAAITSFKLGTLNKKLAKKNASGVDTVYTSTVDCSTYTFQIDQHKGLIWNADSLPYGIDATKVICSVEAKNGGVIGLRRIDNDTIDAYSATDSLDFSKPRRFVAFSESGFGKREYSVSVNVHKEVGDTCIWTKAVDENADIAALTDMKALCIGNTLLLFGSNGTETKVYSTDINDGKVWEAVQTNVSLDINASKSIIQKNSLLYTVSDGKLLCSADGAVWAEKDCDVSLRQLVAASKTRLYALSTENKLVSSLNDSPEWTDEMLDDDAALLPTESIAYIVKPMTVNANTDRIILIGNRSKENYPDDKTAQVWTKVEEYSEDARETKWNYTEFSDVNRYKAPRAKNWQTITYDGVIKAICGKGEGKSNNEALDRFYHSADDGITWRKDTDLYFPKHVTSNNTEFERVWQEHKNGEEKWKDYMFLSDSEFAMTVDAKNIIWIISGTTGQVWRGRINRVAWEK